MDVGFSSGSEERHEKKTVRNEVTLIAITRQTMATSLGGGYLCEELVFVSLHNYSKKAIDRQLQGVSHLLG